MRACAILLAVLPLGAAGCADGEPVSGVIHLDPRLLMRESSGELLSAMGTEWTDEVVVRSVRTDITPWQLRHCETIPSESGAGVSLRGNVVIEKRIARIHLELDMSLEAVDHNAFEVTLASPQNGVAALIWSNDLDEDEDEDERRTHVVYTPFEQSAEPRPVRLSVGNHPDWVGTIDQLTIVPMHEGRQRFDLHGIRFGRSTFAPGPAPLEDDSADGGLIALDVEARRTWPSDFGVPLYDQCTVPIGGRIAVDVAIAGVLRHISDEVHFFVDARPVGGDDWVNVAKRSFVPAEEPLAKSWQTLVGDLAIYGGREVDLRLRSLRGPFRGELEEGTTGRLRRANVYWGNPIVLGALPDDRRPNVVLITLDTTRVDSIGAFGRNQRDSRTPFIDRLCSDGVVFTNAWTVCNSTTPSHASILTGLYVQDHGVANNRSILDTGIATLAERLREAGYYTAAAVSAQHLQAGHSGLGQGFDQFLLSRTEAMTDGAHTIDAVRSWLYQWRLSGERPFFLWVHLFDPHTPYGPPDDFLRLYQQRHRRSKPSRYKRPATIPPRAWLGTGAFLEGVTNQEYAEFLYRAGVAYADELVSRLWAEIEVSTDANETALFLTADHGESLGERGLWFVHRGLFGEVMHVPLLYRPPGGIPQVRNDALVSTVDIPSTIMALVGQAPPGVDLGMRGRNLLELLRGQSWDERRLWFEHSDQVQIGCRDGRHHFIETVEATDLRNDGNIVPLGFRQLFIHRGNVEMGNEIASEKPKLTERYSALVEKWRQGALGALAIPRVVTPEEEAELRRLGYIDG